MESIKQSASLVNKVELNKNAGTEWCTVRLLQGDGSIVTCKEHWDSKTLVTTWVIVRLIRQELRKVKLSDVTVTSYENILGGEFRVIILSTVRTVDSLPSHPPISSTFSLDIFCDPRVLNTVLTRARSQVIVVGDVVALCSFGGCSRIWRRYLRECVEGGSVKPPGLSVEEIKQVVCDLQAWKDQPEDEEGEEDSNSWVSDQDINSEDSILQELLDSKTEACVTVSEEGLMGVRSEATSPDSRNKYINFAKHTLEQYLCLQPNVHKRCLLVKEHFDRGYALTLDDSSPRRIQIYGRVNCGLAFSGDQVLVKLLPNTNSREGQVVGVLEAGEENPFVCFMDPHDPNIMIPLERSVTKIFCPVLKGKPTRVPVRSYHGHHIKTEGSEKVTEEMKRNRAFLVQVIKWDQSFYYPLGIVKRILPKISSLEEGLNILDLEHGVDSAKQYPSKASKEATKITQLLDGLQDCRDMITFTVDPADAKDLDDAISVRDLDDHYEIGVHITDLAAVIPPGSDLDSEAKKRGVTFYSPKREALHMLPLQLCSDLCSLKPHCDRRALSLFVRVEKETDRMVKGHFCHTLIRSDCQLSYEKANSILSSQAGQPLAFSTVDNCVAVCWHFSQVHRVCRLQESATYKQPDEKCPPGARKAHMMIEEMMLMYNSWVAEYLTGKEPLMNLVPVRCQAPPSLQRIEEMRKKFTHLLPLSNYLSHHLLDVPNTPSIDSVQSHQQVTMLTSVWKEVQAAAERQDYDSVADLLSSDDMHPELCHAVQEFRKQLGRAGFFRSCTPDATGHYSLQLCSYTWASSPLRRYLDIVVQRLLQGILSGHSANISTKDMDLLCHQFERRVQQESSFERKAWAMQLALDLKERVHQKMAVVVESDSNSKTFRVVFPLNGDSMPGPVPVDYSALQPTEQPAPLPNGTRLSWRHRVYSFHTSREQPLRHFSRRDITTFSATAWHDAITAVKRGNLEQAQCILRKGLKVPNSMSSVKQSHCRHFMELTVNLHPGYSMPIQLCFGLKHGLPTPIPQLCSPAPGMQLCLEHIQNPVGCFSGLAHRAPLQDYRNYVEYQKVWWPLCAMESVVASVTEGGAVLLRDVPVRWEDEDTGAAVGRKGSFTLSAQLIQDCDLDMDFRNCYLCVRMEGLPAGTPRSSLELDTYTWVAHCLTEPVNHVTKDEGGTVAFCIHQASMADVPPEVLCSTSEFTIEIIPKLLPDIRKEDALDQLKGASELAKSVALGKQVPDIAINSRFRTQQSFNMPNSHRPLNPSQTAAVRTALNQPFTLIQGPPGTGKTVVGVHLVYWFHQMNQDMELPVPNEEEEEGLERRVLMYCGPSNKSVDVVSEMLMPVRTKLRPLRVYSEQMEILEFPYPGSSLRVSGYLREGKPNPQLRPITLHHLIRETSNPYHVKIRKMDTRIRNGEEITDKEVEEYKKLVSEARKVELGRHDIILCTCIASSNVSLAQLPVSQLIIDECAMSTEPETLVPLVKHKRVQSVVLLGDHRQLRPVVLNDVCRSLKMDRSLFERYQERALLLDIQYRMHIEICAFPSQEFYDGRLHTSEQLRLQPSLFSHPRSPCCPVVFGEVDGEEQSLNVTSEEGNINSKANLKEAEQAVRLVKLLIQRSVEPDEIAILTPYNAQVAEVTKLLQSEGLSQVTACTIMKSQGSEWRYVIFSTVRSLSMNQLDSRPTYSWLRINLGFLSDPNQINVGLTRAKEGLCILGNSNLLRCCPLWNRLLQHYGHKRAIVHSSLIRVARSPQR
ncbi:LOW QUALITY PROTEIN: 3'-5' exoribonuclease HELZ2 [Rhinophrynus dorsalis]